MRTFSEYRKLENEIYEYKKLFVKIVVDSYKIIGEASPHFVHDKKHLINRASMSFYNELTVLEDENDIICLGISTDDMYHSDETLEISIPISLIETYENDYEEFKKAILSIFSDEIKKANEEFDKIQEEKKNNESNMKEIERQAILRTIKTFESKHGKFNHEQDT